MPEVIIWFMTSEMYEQSMISLALIHNYSVEVFVVNAFHGLAFKFNVHIYVNIYRPN